MLQNIFHFFPYGFGYMFVWYFIILYVTLYDIFTKLVLISLINDLINSAGLKLFVSHLATFIKICECAQNELWMSRQTVKCIWFIAEIIFNPIKPVDYPWDIFFYYLFI